MRYFSIYYFPSAAAAAAVCAARVDDLCRCSELKTVELQATNLDRLADFEICDIDVELLRNLLIRCCNLNLADRERHTATEAYTCGQTNEVDRNADSDRLLWCNLEEVNVQRRVCYWVELQFLNDCDVLLAVNVKVDDIDVWSVDSLAQL